MGNEERLAPGGPKVDKVPANEYSRKSPAIVATLGPGFGPGFGLSSTTSNGSGTAESAGCDVGLYGETTVGKLLSTL